MYYFDAFGPNSSDKHDSVDWLQVILKNTDEVMNTEEIETFWKEGDKYDNMNNTIERIRLVMTD